MVGFAKCDAKPRECQALLALECDFNMAGLLAVIVAGQIGQDDGEMGTFGRREPDGLRPSGRLKGGSP